MLAHFNLVSDGDYFLDFSRDLDRGSDPSALSRANYAVGRGYLALNMRLERREQFFVDDSVVQSRLPEAEIRLRSRRLGRSPLYLSLVSSAAILDKSGTGFPDGSYGRVDLFPAISAPMSPTPWLDVTPASGTLASGASATVDVCFNATANTLSLGSYNDTVTFTNVTSGVSQTRRVELDVILEQTKLTASDGKAEQARREGDDALISHLHDTKSGCFHVHVSAPGSGVANLR